MTLEVTGQKPTSPFFEKNLRTRYGLTLDEYNRMLDEQHGGCAICGTTEKLVVDHCHQSGEVRGILCDHCNNGLGRFHDIPEKLVRAAQYLKGS